MSRPIGSRSNVAPAYCLHKSSDRAFVTLDGKLVYLRKYGAAESHGRGCLKLGRCGHDHEGFAYCMWNIGPNAVIDAIDAYYRGGRLTYL
jgi:hypothetical protein